MLIVIDLRNKNRRMFYQRMIEDAWLANMVHGRSSDEEYLTFLSKCNSGMVEALRLFKERNDEAPKPESFRVPETGSPDS